MSRIRVLIVDDAVVVRKVVSDALSTDPEIEVVGTAANGRIGLAKIAQLKPDLVTMDVEMPDMDGLEALRELRKSHPRLPVIMFSTLTARGATTTLDALSLGASDYVAKPSNVGGVTEAQTRIRDELIPKIKSLCGRGQASDSAVRRLASPLKTPIRTGTIAKPVAWGPATSGSTPPTGPGAVEVLAVAASTGGPNALTDFFAALGPKLPVPVVVVQHMPPVFTKLLADRLTAKTLLRVEEANDGSKLEPGRVWIAPGDFHMTVERTAAGLSTRLGKQPQENGCRPAADVLFRSVSAVVGRATLAVVLTGMGQDGFLGCEAIRTAGGQILVQDEATSVVWGMPGYVARGGLADLVLPLSELGPEVLRRTRGSRPTQTLGGKSR